ncbi:protein XNDC1N isoform 3-T3 [Alca torda]
MADGPLAPSARGGDAAQPEDYVSRHALRRGPAPGWGANRGPGGEPGPEDRARGGWSEEGAAEPERGPEGSAVPAEGCLQGSWMAPVKISHVVSFSSQSAISGGYRRVPPPFPPRPERDGGDGMGRKLGRDAASLCDVQDPKYPVENLLREDGHQPWLGCPRDRSRQLRVELQLERASAIGYVDVGNCGCAFLQIEVGRSSWPLDQPFLTLVPSVALMTPADSKLGQNRCGVRMFKEADFLALAVGQKWDRLRLTCSQPFNKQGQFGLSFIRLRTPQDAEHPPPSRQGLEDAEPADSPWRSSPAFCRTFFTELRSSSREEEELKSHLQQLEPGARSPARLSRPAQMVLSAARSRASRPRTGTGDPGGDTELPAEDTGGPAVPGLAQDTSAAPTSARRQQPRRQRAPSPAGRALLAASRSGGRARARSHRERRPRRGDSGGDGSQEETGVCPICSGRFSLDLLPVHASRCGEEEPATAWPSSPLVSPDAWVSPSFWVSCPICELPFDAAEVERHASTCGEQG